MLSLRTPRLNGWKSVAIVLAGMLLLVLASSVLFFASLALGVLGAVVLLHLVVLPRLARRLRISLLILDGLLLPLLLGLAWLVTRSAGGLLVALVIWLVGVVGPLVAMRWLRREVVTRWGQLVPSSNQALPTGATGERVLAAARCPHCGWSVWTEAAMTSGRCPQCGQPMAAPR